MTFILYHKWRRSGFQLKRKPYHKHWSLFCDATTFILYHISGVVLKIMAGNGGDIIEISEPTTGNGDLVVQLRQEQRNYSDMFQMYKFTYSMTMSFSNGGDVVLFISDLLNFHGDALQRSFEVILNTCLRNVNLQHFNRNHLIATNYVQFNVEHTDFVDYVYSLRSVKYSDFDVSQLVGGLVNWLSNISQSERKINLMNRWIVQLSISRTDKNSVP